MKKIISSMMVLFMVFAFSCKTGKDVVDLEKNNREVYLPFDKGKYKSDEKTIREIGYGKSDNVYTALNIAKTTSRTEISKTISTLSQSVTNHYVEQGEVRFSEFVEFDKQISKNVLKNVEINESVIVQNEKTKNFECWVVMELKRDNIIDAFSYTLKNSDIDVDNKEYNNIINNKIDKHTFENE